MGGPKLDWKKDQERHLVREQRAEFAREQSYEMAIMEQRETRRLRLEWHGYDVLSKDHIDSVGVPSKAGVYKLATKRADGNYTVFYVGQYTDLNACLNTFSDVGVTGYFSYAVVGLAEDRDGTERALYLFFGPKFNDRDRIPSGPDLEINPKNS